MSLTSMPVGPITLGQSLTLRWLSSSATSCAASASPAEADWQGQVALSGSTTVIPLSPGMQVYSLACSGSGGNATASVTVAVGAASEAPTIASISPTSVFLDAPGTAGSVTISGSGFAPGCVLHDSLLGDATLAAGTAADRITTDLVFDAAHYSPGWISFSVSCPSGNSNTVYLAFVGNQNTLVRAASGALYQLDQAQAAPPGQNGLVRIFNPDGSALGSFLIGAPANGIAFAESTAEVLVSYPGGPVLMYDPASGTAVNTAGVIYAPSVAVAVTNGLGCVTNPAPGDLTCFVVSINLFNPPFVPAAAGQEPWSLALTPHGSNARAVLYARQSTELRLYEVVDVADRPSITPRGVLALAGITPADQVGVSGGWQLLAFDSGVLAGTAALLSQFDRLLVLIDLNSLSELRRVRLPAIPFRMAADAAHGRLLVAFADVAGGVTRFASVDPASGDVTALAATSPLLTTGLTVSADGTALLAAMRSQLSVIAIQ